VSEFRLKITREVRVNQLRFCCWLDSFCIIMLSCVRLIAVLHWTIWLSAYYEQILTECIFDVCALLPLLVVLR